jgi:hypothetical protein
MNGMQYVQRTFTLPASSGKSTSQVKWDLAFLGEEEFRQVHGLRKRDYIDLYC